MNFKFTDCEDEHLPGLRDFLGRMYRPGFILRVSEDFLRWQFSGPSSLAGDAIRLRLVTIDDRIAGCLGYVPTPTSVGGRIVDAAWVMNWMVDEDLRKLGLGPLLMREVVNQYEVLLDVGANADARSVLTRMGWTDFGHVPRHLRVFDIEQASKLTESGRLEWPMLDSSSAKPEPADAKRVDRFGPSATELWDAAWGGDDQGGTRRSMEFLNWRYASHPLFTYRLFETYDQGRLTGIGVYRLEEVKGVPVTLARVTEIVALPGEEASVVNALVEDATEHGAVAMDFFCTSERMSRAMEHVGFVRDDNDVALQLPYVFQPIDRSRRGFGYLALLTKAAESGSITDWYVTSGDGDMDRPN